VGFGNVVMVVSGAALHRKRNNNWKSTIINVLGVSLMELETIKLIIDMLQGTGEQALQFAYVWLILNFIEPFLGFMLFFLGSVWTCKQLKSIFGEELV
jgi:hypothetical protein